MNVAVLAGAVSRPPEVRVLPSGSALVSLDVTVTPDEGPSERVPVAWFDAPASAAELAEGQHVVVLGRVRRRFFKAGGSTQSRTEVVAESVVAVRGRPTKRVHALLGAAGDRLAAYADEGARAG